jgi:hypothetical protein
MAQEHYSRAIRSGQGYAEPVEMRIKDVQEEGRWLDVSACASGAACSDAHDWP